MRSHKQEFFASRHGTRYFLFLRTDNRDFPDDGKKPMAAFKNGVFASRSAFQFLAEAIPKNAQYQNVPFPQEMPCPSGQSMAGCWYDPCSSSLKFCFFRY
jgi:hypothetical protein